MIKKILIIFIVIGSLYIGLKQIISFELQEFIKESKEKYKKFKKETKDMTIFQQKTVVSSKKEIVYKIKLFKKGEKWRLESMILKPVSTQEKKTIIIHTGKDTWMVTSFGKRKLSQQESKNMQIERNWWDLVTKEAKIIGIKNLNKRKCYIIEIRRNSPIKRIWVDKEDLVLIKAEGVSSKGKILVWEYSDFREIGSGWKIPYKTTLYLNNKVISTVFIKSIKINTGLSNKLFEPNEIKQNPLTILDIWKEMIK